ncbi:MAG TPA: glycosyl hydrolase family 18 protein [Limnochordia bacterium]|nr:glycosyl hydrolase family 18 protein [Limnochordia bacterium]
MSIVALLLVFLIAIMGGGPSRQAPGAAASELAAGGAFVNTPSLALHAQPGGDKTIALLKQGETVRVLEEVRAGTGVWEHVTTSAGLAGYVSAFGLSGLAPPPLAGAEREILGYFTPGSGELSFAAHAPSLSTLSPWMWRLMPDGSLQGCGFAEPGGCDAQAMANTLGDAGAHGLRVLALVHNFGGTTFDQAGLHQLLASATAQKAAIENLAGALTSWGVNGIQIDLEALAPADRDAFSAFISDLARRLHQSQLRVTIAVPALTAAYAAQPWGRAYDYAALAGSVDRMMLMTYDEHHLSSAPGPIASIGWAEQVIQYALSLGIPPQKLVLGVAGYGYDWSPQDQSTSHWQARAVRYDRVMQLAAQYQTPILWDATAEVPHLSYGNHQVWFEDRFSISHKLDLVDRYNLGGIAIWQLGQEDPGVWSLFDELLH